MNKVRMILLSAAVALCVLSVTSISTLNNVFANTPRAGCAKGDCDVYITHQTKKGECAEHPKMGCVCNLTDGTSVPSCS
jgi:hypothetical protein